MKAEHYFNELDLCIKKLASKADLLLFDAMPKDEYDEIYETVLILHIFHISVFGERSEILANFIENVEVISDKKMSRQFRKETGSYFTPIYISEYICDKTISPLVDKIIDDKRVRKKVDKICKLKICDPAMGGGIFLVCAHDLLMRKLIELDQDDYSVEELSTMSSKCIFGVDINPDAVDMAKLTLNLNVAKWKMINKFDEYVCIAEKSLS